MSLVKKARRESYVKRTNRVRAEMEKHRPLVVCHGPIHPVDVTKFERLERNLEYATAKVAYWDKRLAEEA